MNEFTEFTFLTFSTMKRHKTKMVSHFVDSFKRAFSSNTRASSDQIKENLKKSVNKFSVNKR